MGFCNSNNRCVCYNDGKNDKNDNNKGNDKYSANCKRDSDCYAYCYGNKNNKYDYDNDVYCDKNDRCVCNGKRYYAMEDDTSITDDGESTGESYEGEDEDENENENE